jgi:hypothetical protein
MFFETIYYTTMAISTHVHQLINFEKIISTNGIFLNIHYFPSKKIYLKEIIFEIFSIFENNIINVKLAKVLRYMLVSWEPTVI